MAIAVGLMTHLVSGCASYQPEVVRTSPVAREEFDPQSLADDSFVLKPTGPAPALPAWQSPPSAPQAPASTAISAEGYRVQIAAVRDRARAESFRSEAQKQFEQPVYTFFDEDTRLYKIHLGNARTASDAVRLRREAKGRGYREAYVVKTRIEVAPTKIRRPSKVQGFRVQIFSASNQQAAEQELERAKGLLGREDVYVDFEPPFFKVRVGDFQDRRDAESLLDGVKDKGYETPFLVRTQVIVQPE
jgi:cell division septation protein DedD